MPSKVHELWNPARAKLELDKALAGRRAGRDVVGRAIWPVPGGVISQGVVPGHTAIDIVARLGAPVVATHPGRVTAVYDTTVGYGRNVRVLMTDGIEAVYAHLQNFAVKVGDVLRPGQQVGTLGATGTKAPHLHLEYRQPAADVFDGGWSTTTAVNPLQYLAGTVASIIPKAATTTTQAISSLRAAAVRPSPAADTVNILADTPSDDDRFGVGITLPVIGRVGVGYRGPGAGVASDIVSGDPFGISDIVEKVKPSVERLMYGWAGVALMIVGLVILAISFRGELRGGAKYINDIISPVTEVIPG